MTELDLIPSEYRQELLVRNWLKIFCLTYVALFAGIGGSKYILHAQTLALEQQVSTFELDRQEVIRKQQILTELHQERADLENRIRIRDRLKGGPSAQQNSRRLSGRDGNGLPTNRRPRRRSFVRFRGDAEGPTHRAEPDQ